MNEKDIRQVARDIFYSSLEAVSPYSSVRDYSERIRCRFEKDHFRKLVVIGFGKAACPMAQAARDSFGDLIDSSVVITKYGHCMGKDLQAGPHHEKIRIYEAGHPVPDGNGLQATEEVIRLLRKEDGHTLVVCLVSGGGSALLVSPYEGITLSEKQDVTTLLLNAGADIHELNTVRKHISRVKGGRLAGIAFPAAVITLLLSDVIGNRLDVIASGPTAPDSSTFRDALNVIGKYDLMDKIPPGIKDVLLHGERGVIPETPKEDDRIFRKVENMVIGSNIEALQAAKKEAEANGFRTEVVSSEISGDARDAGKWLARKAAEARHSSAMHHGEKKVCLISGGETTVTVKGNGLGGRNMELALSFAIEAEREEGITLLSAGTDGTDGPTDAAGAIVDCTTAGNARAAGLDPSAYLEDNDSYTFFKKTGSLFITGPTGTNVMDLQIVLLG